MTEEENLKNLAYFFSKNEEIKRILLSCAPTEDDFNSKENYIAYQNNLVNKIKILKDYFTSFSILFDLKIKNFINNLFDNIMDKIANLDNFISFRNFYIKYFSDLDCYFVDKVANNCVGYVCDNALLNLIGDCHSLNELLHLIHSYIVNNEKIYHQMPLVAEKKCNKYESKKLYGLTNDSSETMIYAKKIFAQMLMDDVTDLVDVLPVSSQNKILIMVRDRGHALTIQIDLNDKYAYIDYFIPKICNVDMVNQLPGVHNYGNYATGTISASKNDLDKVLFDFVTKVPTDADMFINGNYSK